MPKGDAFGNQRTPLSRPAIETIISPHSQLGRFLYPMAKRDVVFVFDDFSGPAQNTHLWSTESDTNATSFDPPATQLLSGVTQGKTGETTNEAATIYGDAAWKGDFDCGLEFWFKLDEVGVMTFECGWNDPLTQEEDSILDDIDTPALASNGQTDVAFVGMDTGQTLKTMAFITDGGTGNMNTTKTDLGTRTPTADAYMGIRIQLQDNRSYCYLLNASGGVTESAVHGIVLASQIEGGTLIKPRLMVETEDGTDHVCDIDYIAVWQNRVATIA